MRTYSYLLPIILLTFLSGSLFAQDSKPAEKPKPVVLSASEYDYPPFCIVTPEGKADGLAVELLQKSLALMGRSVTFKVGPWAEVKQSLVDGKVQVLPLVGRTPEREDEFDFTFPYLTLHGAIVVRSDTQNIHAMSDLAGKSIAVMKGDNAEEFLRKNDPGATLILTKTFDEALHHLSEGKCDAVVIQRLLALNLIRDNGFQNLRIIKKPLLGLRQAFCFAVREGDKELLATLNEGLALAMADGTFSQLTRKWLLPLEQGSSNRRIVVAGDESSPPYEFLDEDGNPTGYIVDLTRAIAKQADLDVEIRLLPFSDVRKGLESGEIDIVQGMFYSTQRDDIYNFSPVHAYAHYSVFGKTGSPWIDKVKDLSGKRVAVMRGDFMHDLAVQDNLQKDLILTPTQEDALRLLAEGKCDYAMVMSTPGRYYIQKNKFKGIASRSAPVMSPEYCYAVMPANDRLLAKFNEGLNTLHKNGEYRKIYDKWLGVYEDKGIDYGEFLRAIVLITVPLLVILLVSLLWSRKLSARVAEKTASLNSEMEERAHISEKLQQSEERLILAQRCAGIGIWDYELATARIHWSQEMYRAYRIEPDEFDGDFQSFEKMLHPVDRARVTEEVRLSVETGVIYDTEYRIITPRTHETVWLSAMGRTIYNEQGEPTRMLGAVLNIDERKRAEAGMRERERFFRSMFEENHAVMLLVDAESKQIKDANDAACSFYGYDRAQLCSMSLTDINPLSKERIESGLESAQDRTQNQFRFPHKLASGEIRQVVVYSSPVTLSGRPMIFSIVHDISERIEAQRRLEERTSDLVKANEDLQQFAYISSHDLQEPLRSISGFMQLLERRYSDRLDESGLNYVHRAVAAAKRLQDLIESLLAYSRVETRGEEFELVDLNALLENIQQNLDYQIQAANAHIQVDSLPTVHGDAGQLLVLFQNLLSNAIKFRSPEMEPVINISVHQEENEMWRFDVRDNGIGISPDYYERIFKIFQRLHTRTDYAGNGMGLAISQRIANRHGGNIDVDSTPGEGSTFHVWISAHIEKELS